MELPLLVFWESTVTDEDRSDRDDAVDRPLPLLIKGDSVPFEEYRKEPFCSVGMGLH